MNWLMMTSRFARISSGRWIGYAWVVALAGSLALSGWLAHQRTKKVEEYPFGCDSFGYLWMAQEIRQAAAGRRLPQFRLETEHTRLLIELLRSRGVPVESWDEMIAPHAHHYFPAANHVGVQYPPGTGLLLALFPQGEAVSGLNHAVILLFLTAGFSLLAFAAARRAWVSAGFVALALHLGLDILANIGDISFSINAVLVPLLFSFLCLFGARWLRLRRARTGLDADDTESAAAAGSGDFAPRLLALAGGLFFGFAVLVRLPVLFLLPGLFVLLWPAHSSLSWQLRRALAPRALLRSDLILFSAVVFLCGLVPLLAHQYRMAGAWYLSTYGRADNASPNLDTVSRNLSYYLGTGPGAEDNWALFAIFAGFAGFAFYFHRCGRAARDFGLMSWQRVALAALVLWGVPTAYFLTHAIRIHYYPKPSTFGAALLLALGALTIEGRAARLTVPEAGGTPHWSLRRVALLFALVPGLLMIDLSRLRVSAALVAERPAAARYLDVPAELRDRRAWVWADLLTGTLWYYARVPAYKVAFGSHENRALAYRLAFERGEPQYVVRDSEIMQRMTNEIEQMGGMLEPRGQVGAHPYFLIRWPPGGPNLSAF